MKRSWSRSHRTSPTETDLQYIQSTLNSQITVTITIWCFLKKLHSTALLVVSQSVHLSLILYASEIFSHTTTSGQHVALPGYTDKWGYVYLNVNVNCAISFKSDTTHNERKHFSCKLTFSAIGMISGQEQVLILRHQCYGTWIRNDNHLFWHIVLTVWG